MRREPGPDPRRAASGRWASAPASDECRRCRRTRRESEWSSRNRCLAPAAPCRWRPRPPSRRTSRPDSAPDSTDCGWRPNSALLVLAPQANSGVLVLASTMAPEALRRRTTSASSAGTWSLNKRRCKGGADARGRRDVLDRDRQAVQGAERFAVRDRRFRRARGIPRLLGGERDDRVELRVDPFDHRQMGVEHLDRTHVAAADQPRQLARGPAGEAHVDHHLFVSWSMIFSENRYPLFGIMLYLPAQCTKRRSTSRNSRLSP